MTREMKPGTVEELLPFYVNGSLSAAERAMVEAVLEADDALRREVEMLRQIRETWQSQPDADGVGPGEAGLSRLLGDLDALEEAEIPVEMARIPSPANENAPLRRWKQAGALAASMAIGVFLGFGLQNTPEGGVAVPASGGASLTDAPTITVLFQDDVVLADVSDLLDDTGFIIVDGPSAMGLYRLASFDLSAPTVEQVEVLSARGDIFARVEGPE